MFIFMNELANKILKEIFIKNNIHWQTKAQLEWKWDEGCPTLSKKDAIEAMEIFLKEIKKI